MTLRVFDHNHFEEHTVARGDAAVAAAKATISVDFVYAGGGVGKGAKVSVGVDGACAP